MEEKSRIHYVVSVDVDDLDAALRVLDELFVAVLATLPDQRPSVTLEYAGRWYTRDEED